MQWAPPSPDGRGGVGERRRYHLQNTVGIFENVAVPETEHAIALSLKESRPFCILRLPNGMLTPIDFNDKPLPEA